MARDVRRGGAVEHAVGVERAEGALEAGYVDFVLGEADEQHPGMSDREFLGLLGAHRHRRIAEDGPVAEFGHATAAGGVHHLA